MSYNFDRGTGFPKDYNHETDNQESFSYCPGAGQQIDLSQFEPTEQLYSAEYNTYCAIQFCGLSDACNICRQKNNPKTLK